MDLFAALLFAAGLVTGLLAGMLGIGGGIVLAPILLYVPPLAADRTLTMKEVSGITIVQTLLAAVLGSLLHQAAATVHRRAVRIMAPTMFLACLAGGYGSRWLENRALLGIFGAMATAASALLFLPRTEDGPVDPDGDTPFSAAAGATVAALVGGIGGLVGQTGAFLLIPLLIYALGVPTRKAIGSSLAILFAAALAGATGKALAGQVPWGPTAWVLAGSAAGVPCGAWVGRRLPARALRLILALLIAAAAVRIWIDVGQGP